MSFPINNIIHTCKGIFFLSSDRCQINSFYHFRSCRREVFYRKGVLRNFAKFTGKHLCQSLFFHLSQSISCFPVNFAKFLRIPFFTGHLRWLLLLPSLKLAKHLFHHLIQKNVRIVVALMNVKPKVIEPTFTCSRSTMKTPE